MCDSKDNSGVSEKCGKKFTNYPLNTTPTSLNYNLPEISKKFYNLKNKYSRNGYGLSKTEFPSSIENCPSNEYSIMYDNKDPRFLIRFLLDDGRYIIADRDDGEVFDEAPTYLDNNNHPIISRHYTGEERQKFEQVGSGDYITGEQFFQFYTQNKTRVLSNCRALDSRTILLSTAKIFPIYPPASETQLTAFVNSSFYAAAIPQLPQTSLLENIPEPTSLDDSGVLPKDAVRAVKGSALLPCIIVHDPNLNNSDKMKFNTYYLLEYKEYWHQLWSQIIPAHQTVKIQERTGISEVVQNSMIEDLNMYIGADFGMLFYFRSSGFKEQITRGLNRPLSQTTTQLGERVEEMEYYNSNDLDVRYVKYALAREFPLRRVNGEIVKNWVAVDYRLAGIQSYPNAPITNPLTLTKHTIIRCENSYDGHIFKTPLIFKNGEVIVKTNEELIPKINQ
uniref:Binary toxin B n=1 Tax=Lysinibacillus sphaericus TaxID=1421 RepID=Q0MQM8_LYSSH|nr:binary toxin B [Lysinibacillus sphaericus]